MKPHGMDGFDILVRTDEESGMFVGTVEDNYYGAANMMRVGGPAVKAADVSSEGLESGKDSLEAFLKPVSGRPGLYDIEEGVTVSFKNPFDIGSREITSQRIRELVPPAEAQPQEV